MSDSKYILVIDDQGAVIDVARLALDSAGVKVAAAAEVASAKRVMLQRPPEMIFCNVGIGEEKDAGIRLCQELRAHPVLSQVPLILVTESISEELIRTANDSGASGLLGWPVTVDAIVQRVSAVVPIAKPKASAKPEVAEKPESKASVEAANPEFDSKLKLVQQLLARVLHNLKTSDLLHVVEVDDVPQVVEQMTRSVCAEQEQLAQTQAEREESGGEFDLESAFSVDK